MFNRYYLLLLIFFIGIYTNAMASGSGAFRVELPDAGVLGKGTAFVGEANTPAAIYYNPAGLTQVVQGAVSVGTAFLAPQVDYNPSAGDQVQMRRNKFLIPHIYAVTPLIADKFSFGFGGTSYFGLGTEWAPDSPLKYEETKSNITNQDYMLTLAYKVTDQWSIAVSADNDNSKASKSKRIFQSTGADDANFQLKVKDDAWGYRLATMFKLSERHQFGLMYRSRISHKYEGKAYLDGLNNAGTTPYNAIFGGSSYETRISEKFTLPQSVVIGYSFKPGNKWTFNIDAEWMDWSSIKHEAINWLDETDPTRLSVLNVGNPASRDWKSVWAESIGAEYAATDRLRLRGGYYHHMSPIPQDTWDANLPDANSHGFTAGFGYALPIKISREVSCSKKIHVLQINSEFKNKISYFFSFIKSSYFWFIFILFIRY